MSHILALNWKMNPATLAESIDLLDEYWKKTEVSQPQFAVFPPSLYLSDLFEYAEDFEMEGIAFGVQDIATSESGAHTSQISASMAESVGAQYVLVGHSETRAELGVTNEQCAQKIALAEKNGLTAVLCVGHGAGENLDKTLIRSQIVEALQPLITASQPTEVWIAYEPVWAIGTGKTAGADHIAEVSAFIRLVIDEEAPNLAETTYILYGGSVKGSNIQELSQIPGVDGFLVGGAALDANEVKALWEAVK